VYSAYQQKMVFMFASIC